MAKALSTKNHSVHSHKHIHWDRVALEGLEGRMLLSGGPQPLGEETFVPITWQGQNVLARAGQWILEVDNVHGKAAEQLKTVNGLLAGVGANARALRHLGSDGLVLLEAPGNLTLGQMQRSLRGLRGLRNLEPDLVFWAGASTSNDPSFSSLWGLHNTGQSGGTVDADIDAPEAWDLARGDGSVVVGVIDSGIDYNHPDLAANVWINPGEIAGNGLDDDGNGYVDDVHGWDFYNNDNNPMDDNGHGTHVAGTIAAIGNNALGVVGVNWAAKVMALKFLGSKGSGSLSGAIAALNYATQMRSTYGINVRLTNNSWGGGGYSSTLYNAIKNSGSAGLLFVAAAGNGGSDQVGDNNDSAPSYPASYNLDNIVSVAATDRNDQLASFSNYGASSVDLAAPGVSILSTTRGGGYGYMSGTSMATPHVSGVAALAWSYSPAATVATIRSALLNGADAKSSLSGKTATGGRLNAFNTLMQLAPPTSAPAAPSGLSASALSSSQINLAWADNSSDESGFKVFRSSDGVNFTLLASVGAGVRQYSDTGLAASTTYHYRVRAYNLVGESADSNVASATTQAPLALPEAPTDLSLAALSKTQIALSWTDNSANESGFKIERSTNGSKWSQIALVGADVTAFTNSGLRRNTTYYYRVRAYNAAGDSGYSNTASTKTLASATRIQAARRDRNSLFSTVSIRESQRVR